MFTPCLGHYFLCLECGGEKLLLDQALRFIFFSWNFIEQGDLDVTDFRGGQGSAPVELKNNIQLPAGVNAGNLPSGVGGHTRSPCGFFWAKVAFQGSCWRDLVVQLRAAVLPSLSFPFSWGQSIHFSRLFAIFNRSV